MIAVAALSGFQYINQGEITWLSDLLHSTTDTVSDYALRPQAGWRKATDVLDRAGASKDGVPASGFSLSGRVVRVADGDTLSVLDATNTQHKIRLYGIDTPERDQPHGKAAWNTLSAGMLKMQEGMRQRLVFAFRLVRHGEQGSRR